MLSILTKPVMRLVRKLEGKGYTVAVIQKTEAGIEFQITKQIQNKIAGLRYCMLLEDIMYGKADHVQLAFEKIDQGFKHLEKGDGSHLTLVNKENKNDNTY